MFGGLFGPSAARGGASEGATAGVGYGGGGSGDTKRLLAGRKKAERASSKDDKATLRYLKQLQKQMKSQSRASRGGANPDLDNDDKKKVSELLADTFRNQVPSDWDKRRELYNVALDVTSKLASNRTLGKVLGDRDDQEGLLFWLLDFSDQCEQIIKHHAENGWSREDDDVSLATRVKEVADAALKMSRRCIQKQEAELSVISLGERYQSQLGPLRFDTVDSMQNHYFANKVTNAPSTLDTRSLFKELAAYRTALPVEYGSSCFCRVINGRMDLLRVMITGPDETPYAAGCFFFDVQLPASYPKTSPNVHFLTTGGGRIHFNPNLYNCGKVCLSLLGTWQGPGWISGQSTLLQVLISIQSLILVPDPYFNEPCYESARGTQSGKAQSDAYNKTIRKHTISAAIESHLSSILAGSNQYAEFEPAMIKHFLEKSSLIQQELWAWVKDDRSLSHQVTNVCNQLSQLATRERGKKRSRPIVLDNAGGFPAKRAPTNEPIILDDASGVVAKKNPASNSPILLEDDTDVQISHPLKKVSHGPLKSNEPINIDLSGDEDDKKEGDHCANMGGGDVVDLT